MSTSRLPNTVYYTNHSELPGRSGDVENSIVPDEDNDYRDGDSTKRNSIVEPPGSGSRQIVVDKTDTEKQSRGQQGFLVSWDGPDDPDNPLNFPARVKCTIVLLTGAVTFCVSFASSVFSTATAATALEFHVSEEVMILGVSLYVFGFALGPLIWGPMSERYGRCRPISIGFSLFIIFQIPVAVAQNLETIFLCRFFGGVFGAAPLAIVSSSYVDFLSMVDRGVAMSVFAAAVFLGPVLGPIVGSFLTESYLGWRWTAWITMIMSAFFGVLYLVFVPETYAPILLQRRAQVKRHATKEWAWHSTLDETPTTFTTLYNKYLSKPFRMMYYEPVLDVLVAYGALVYSILYVIFFAYPYSFQKTRGWSPGIASLPFLGLMVGVISACIYMAVDTKTRFQRALKRDGKLVPEQRLPPMIVGSVVLPIGLFWFAWTSSPKITWVPQVISGVFIGMGMTTVFFNGVLYLVDVYLQSAPSALAANTFVRSASAAGFPLFSTYMYQRLGVAWATSLLGFLCIAMLPFPIIFWFYGAKMRSKGNFTIS
ncbi:hypothetical protein BP6252_02473 [Coleophoma cylindrospora]|uniref:Major facilitator superfamily (MFS) profile domain-containing protein n=1 Tax=Coleophoma cylindrospora TaxID=1849047 RepID=A0A3D8SF12_9HELO|nr:hypothetical protein BP6252_02473 [Coleophoma cylindrospora]